MRFDGYWPLFLPLVSFSLVLYDICYNVGFCFATSKNCLNPTHQCLYRYNYPCATWNVLSRSWNFGLVPLGQFTEWSSNECLRHACICIPLERWGGSKVSPMVAFFAWTTTLDNHIERKMVVVNKCITCKCSKSICFFIVL